jgi:succinoglycan biosynthesis transport protein ExoP
MREVPQTRTNLLTDPVIGHLASHDDEPRPIKLSIILDFLVRNARNIALVTLVVVTCGIAYTFVVSPRYTATTKLLIDYVHAQIGEGSTAVVDQGAVDSQVELLKSEGVILSMIKDLKLDDEEASVGDSSLIGSMLAPFQAIGEKIGLGGAERPPGATDGDAAKAAPAAAAAPTAAHQETPESRRARSLVDKILANLWVSRVGKSYIVDISYTSPDPVQAAQIANGVARAYMAEQVAAKSVAAKDQTAWLLTRVQELQKQATESARAVQVFRATHSVMPSQELDLEADSSRLDQEKNKTSDEIAAVHKRVEAVTAFISKIDQLPAQISRADLKGAPDDIQAVIANETSFTAPTLLEQANSVLGMLNDAEKSAQQTLTDISGKAADLERRKQQMELDQAKVRDLETAAATSRSLQESFLNQFTVAARQQNFPSSDARVVAEAATPLFRAYPRRGITVILSGAFGVILGLGLAFLREQIDDKIRSRSTLEERTGISCIGHIRELTAHNPIDNPDKIAIETLRSIQAAADLCSPSGPRVIGVTSCLAKEGKSTVALLLGEHLSSWGRSTLLVDCGRNSTLSELLVDKRPEHKTTKTSQGANGSGFSCACIDDNLDLLRIGSEELRRVDISRIMDAVIRNADDKYEYIIVDCPALLDPVALRGLSSWIGLGIVVTQWGRVSIDQLERGLQRSGFMNARYLSAVFNRVDLSNMKKWEGSKASLFGSEQESSA